MPSVQEAGWTTEPVWIGAENLAPPAFDPRTFQPVASRYTDYATRLPIASENLMKIPLFELSLIHQLRLLGLQQHPQSRVLLTSFSTWGKEHSLAELNLESTGGGGDKGL